MGRVRQTPLPSVHPHHQLAQVFSDYFCGKIKIRDNLDAQARAPPPHIVHERSFSGTSLTQLDVVTEDTVRKTMLKMSPKTL